ncbi:uncharacterized protein LOC111875880 isoform X2 [Lactuca sativa]|uniref:DM2 domain-containing protein n=1 Tax=Lactuca sativa TaxID=4236 RepID=A0A9R1VZK3_LACSA|nr:uncharacterized protein LOC111875880 isoform X2 [Lactuca sativa]KAJ0214424.1 hypothetical protein LSAT_V11C400181560 [Lactuca sativa]
MVSDQEIAKGIQILLTQSHPKSFTTLDHVVNQLGEKLGFDLSHKAAFIRDQINLLLFHSHSQFRNPPPPPQPSVPSPVTTSAIPKDQFSFQHQQPQFHFNQQQPHAPPPLRPQYHHSHFPFEHQEQRPRHPVELNFGNPEAPPPEQSRVQTLPEVKYEGFPIQNAVWKSPEKIKKGPSANKRRGGPGGLNKLCGISPELQVILGKSSLSRTDIVKQLWAYIKKNNLQDPGNKRKIICDDALRVVFETDSTDMFKMNKLLAKHIIPLEPTKASSRRKPKVKVESSDFVPCQVIISESLANCLNMQERQMSQSEALRLVWEYIKVNNLEDPENPVMIICDAKLMEIFGCESISAMEIPELLVKQHLLIQ